MPFRGRGGCNWGWGVGRPITPPSNLDGLAPSKNLPRYHCWRCRAPAHDEGLTRLPKGFAGRVGDRALFPFGVISVGARDGMNQLGGVP